jgi:hypothetical protein
MHVKQLRHFLDYKPVFLDAPQHIVDEIVELAKEFIAPKDLPLIQLAYEFAKEAHKS